VIDGALDEARALLRQGLLEPASAALARIPADAPLADRAAAALLAGNVAYERGRYADARDRWLSAQSLYGQAGAGEESTRAVVANLALADERLQRQQELAGQAGTLRLQLAGALLLAAAAVAVAYRMSRTSSSTGERAR
jgi:hypothetical protein